jgi:ribosomal protein S18 acetylase RimI-like enzyme
MTDFTCRDATPDDAAALADLFARCFTETFGHLYRPDDLEAFLASVTAETFAEELGSPDFVIRVAETGSRLIGFAKIGPSAVPIETPPETAELRQIYVLRPWHGRGVAQQLYDWAEEEARRRRHKHLQLTVYIENERARRFYERRGFVGIGRYDFMVGNHADEDIVMRKPL